ncbi:hypothetical protein EJ02DRAFT_183432 [Clathrospora elynae]|uniref:MaoC-like domain-containing protein n=1 Tax=Clathrospora elynae TaxID=706981 RepID=A0A6A5SN87_9PLEO|nr:hypothetical protein EJ02DRAFT_183432 [Clathrospora elynae]
MLPRTPCTPRIGTTAPWRRLPVRCYASAATSDPPWFQQLRAEMLQRDVTHLPEHTRSTPERWLASTISGFLPREWCIPPGINKPIIPVGHHLIWFNPALPTHELLPDGTDASQSPGEPWVRRMWAGGSLKLKPDDYFDKAAGFRYDVAMAGAERITDVQLRGQDDAAKVLVTIERRFARLDTLRESHVSTRGPLGRSGHQLKLQRHFEQQVRADDGWGDAIFKEERILVFFKERTAAELEAIRAGEMAPVRYLEAPGTPHFSHALTPNRALLFRFSALTFNAHRIHLDRDFARDVEGHRNLLVHGPLALTLMLQVLTNYVTTHTKGEQVVESIEYRNLAPLYCDEEMRICGLEKKILQNGSAYDVWIEGPTGGVAVKGIVYTAVRKRVHLPVSTTTISAQEAKASSSNERRELSDGTKPTEKKRSFARETPLQDRKRKEIALGVQHGKDIGSNVLHGTFQRLRLGTTESESSTGNPSPETVSKPEQPTRVTSTRSTGSDTVNLEGESSQRPMPIDRSSQTPSREALPAPTRAAGRVYIRSEPTRIRSYQFITKPSISPSIRCVDTVRPVKPTTTLRSRSIMRRLAPQEPSKPFLKPLPIVRKFDATPYIPDTTRTAARHSRFNREGARKFEKPNIRTEGESLAHERRRRRVKIGHFPR